MLLLPLGRIVTEILMEYPTPQILCWRPAHSGGKRGAVVISSHTFFLSLFVRLAENFHSPYFFFLHSKTPLLCRRCWWRDTCILHGCSRNMRHASNVLVGVGGLFTTRRKILILKLFYAELFSVIE